YWWFRDLPAEHPAVNRAEVELIGAAEIGSGGHGAVPWGHVAVHPTIWLLSAIIILSAFNSYFFFSSYPTYLQEARTWYGDRLSNEIAKWLAALALAGATAGSLLGGYVADVITRRAADRYGARRMLCLGCFWSAALCLGGSVLVDDTVVAGF